MKPLVIDLFCGLGGWTKGFLAEGYRAVGFDIERHVYPGDHGSLKQYPGDLVLQDILTIRGSQFRDAAAIVASPPCQEYSYMAMPWSRAKQIAGALREETPEVFPEGYDGSRTLGELNALFDACFRLQREASEAAGRQIPMVVENVKGAQPWVGPARAHFGSFFLWGDIESVGGRIVGRVPKFGESLRAAGRARKFNPDGTQHGQGSWFAIADSKERGAQKREGRNFHAFENGLGSSPSFNGADHETRGVNTESGTGQNPVNGSKVPGINWSGHGEPGYKAQGFNVTAAQRYREEQGVKHGGDCFSDPGWPGKQGGVKQNGDTFGWSKDTPLRNNNSKSDSRKAASAAIAEIPLDLSRYIARILK